MFSEYGKWISDAVQGWAHPNIIVDYEEAPVPVSKNALAITVQP